MNETQDRPPEDTPSPDDAAEPGDGFDAGRLRTIADMRRSGNDRMVAGVCTGAARYLNIDPVVVRVVFGVLTFVGLSGVILYVAAWFFLPADDSDQSIAADWFHLDRNEEQVRTIGLVGAAVLATLSIIGDRDWAWGGLFWVLLPLAFLYWLFVVRPRHRDLDRRMVGDDDTHDGPASLEGSGPAAEGRVTRREARRTRREERSPALSVLTVSLAAIVVAVAMLVAQANDGTDWTTYVAVALGVVAVGLLVSTFVGRPGPLVPIGLLLTLALAVGAYLPSPRIGEQSVDPAAASDVVGEYEHGIGLLELDLSDVRDPNQLLGSTIRLDNGVGQTKVVVPDGLNLAIDAHLSVGEINAFDRTAHGTDNDLTLPADDPTTAPLTLRIDQSFGNVEVVRR